MRCGAFFSWRSADLTFDLVTLKPYRESQYTMSNLCTEFKLSMLFCLWVLYKPHYYTQTDRNMFTLWPWALTFAVKCFLFPVWVDCSCGNGKYWEGACSTLTQYLEQAANYCMSGQLAFLSSSGWEMSSSLPSVGYWVKAAEWSGGMSYSPVVR